MVPPATGRIATPVTGVLWLWTFRSLGKNLTDTVVTRKDHALVTAGPYRWVRHPLYLGFALAAVADTLVTADWFVALTATATVALLMVRTRTEEEKLVERFGDAYLDYRERTGQFLPRVISRALAALARHSRESDRPGTLPPTQ